jgi:hypothetical protein
MSKELEKNLKKLILILLQLKQDMVVDTDGTLVDVHKFHKKLINFKKIFIYKFNNFFSNW